VPANPRWWLVSFWISAKSSTRPRHCPSPLYLDLDRRALGSYQAHIARSRRSAAAYAIERPSREGAVQNRSWIRPLLQGEASESPFEGSRQRLAVSSHGESVRSGACERQRPAAVLFVIDTFEEARNFRGADDRKGPRKTFGRPSKGRTHVASCPGGQGGLNDKPLCSRQAAPVGRSLRKTKRAICCAATSLALFLRTRS